jgi:hypothetical protein
MAIPMYNWVEVIGPSVGGYTHDIGRRGLLNEITVKHQGGPPPLGGGRNWVHFPVYFRSALHTYLSYQIHLLYVLGHLRHPPGKPFDADPVRLCQTLARKGTAETRFEVVSGRSEANVPARLGPLQIVAACRLAWRSGQISDSETDLLRAAESPSPSGEG